MARSISTAWREPKGAASTAALDPPIVWRAGEGPGSSIPTGAAAAGEAPAQGLWCAGRIANRSELIARLGADGAVADAELVARLYARSGPRAADQIEGAVAWIVWDPAGDRLVAARDRLGLRGLYFVAGDDGVALSDRVAPLLPHAGSPPRWRTDSLVAQIHGVAPPPGATCYRHVEAVNPGELLIVGRRLERRTYWSLQPPRELRLPSDEAYGEALRALLVETTRGYAAGGALGVTLSGGLDSTAVAWTLRELQPEAELTAVSWTSPELPEADESATIAEVTDRLRLAPVAVPADRHWSLSDPDGFATAVDGPFRNYYDELWQATFERARDRGLRTLFSGASGDHLFGGGRVQPLVDLLLAGRWARLARRLGEQAEETDANALGVAWSRLARPLLSRAAPAALRRRRRPASWLTPGHRRTFRELQAAPPAPHRTLLPGRRAVWRTLRDPLLGTILERLDRQAAAAGLEILHPLLDRRLVEFAAGLPADQLVRGGRRKVIVRNAMRGRLPDSVVERHHKVYPSAIFRRGIVERERAKAEALMRGMRAAEIGLVDEAELRRAWQRYLAGEGDSLFWHTLALEDWLRRWF